MKTNDLINAAEIFNYDSETGVVSWKETGRPAGHINDRGYQVIEYRGKRYKAHRIAWTLHYGQPPRGEIDHKNQVKSDNRISNLRDTCCQGNMRNRPLQRNNTSGVTGVVWHSRDEKWVAKIKYNGRWLWLGAFTHKQDAINARKIAEEVYGFSDNHGKQ